LVVGYKLFEGKAEQSIKFVYLRVGWLRRAPAKTSTGRPDETRTVARRHLPTSITATRESPPLVVQVHRTDVVCQPIKSRVERTKWLRHPRTVKVSAYSKSSRFVESAFSRERAQP
jgi:hypothetical protein